MLSICCRLAKAPPLTCPKPATTPLPQGSTLAHSAMQKRHSISAACMYNEQRRSHTCINQQPHYSSCRHACLPGSLIRDPESCDFSALTRVNALISSFSGMTSQLIAANITPKKLATCPKVKHVVYRHSSCVLIFKGPTTTISHARIRITHLFASFHIIVKCLAIDLMQPAYQCCALFRSTSLANVICSCVLDSRVENPTQGALAGYKHA